MCVVAPDCWYYRDYTQDIFNVLLAAELVLEKASDVFNLLGLFRYVLHITGQILNCSLW